MPNAADRKSIRAQEKAARLADQQRRDVIVMLMSTTPGRAWMWDRLSDCAIFSSTHVAGDALGSAFQEGRRSVGLALLADIMAYAPDQFTQAMREANERHITDRIRDPDADPDPDVDSTAERRSGPIGNGRDSGALADRNTDADTAEDGFRAAQSPGFDIYVEGPGQQGQQA